MMMALLYDILTLPPEPPRYKVNKRLPRKQQRQAERRHRRLHARYRAANRMRPEDVMHATDVSLIMHDIQMEQLLKVFQTCTE